METKIKHTVGDAPLTLADIARKHCIDYKCLTSRLHRGIPLEDALYTPTKDRLYEYKGEQLTSNQIQSITGRSKSWVIYSCPRAKEKLPTVHYERKRGKLYLVYGQMVTINQAKELMNCCYSEARRRCMSGNYEQKPGAETGAVPDGGRRGINAPITDPKTFMSSEELHVVNLVDSLKRQGLPTDQLMKEVVRRVKECYL